MKRRKEKQRKEKTQHKKQKKTKPKERERNGKFLGQKEKAITRILITRGANI